MDPVTIGAVLAAIISGAGGQLGGQLWEGMVSLIRRPLRPAPLHLVLDPAIRAN